VLFNGKAFSLNRDALVIGRTPSASHAISLSEGLAGVSRRHCTFVRIAGEVILVDHSSFGTFVNGERVSERVRVHAGDRVRVGEPGVELSLIAIGDGAGSVHGTPPR
jgi:pSer/pThr/pTyr-binding forkhead associated (FHA) protein